MSAAATVTPVRRFQQMFAVSPCCRVVGEYAVEALPDGRWAHRGMPCPTGDCPPASAHECAAWDAVLAGLASAAWNGVRDPESLDRTAP